MDMSATIAPKSDQMNADDLIAGPRVITVTGVSGSADPKQPVAIAFDGDGGKPYKPCKSMRRVMVHLWGSDAKEYAGRSMRIYRDPGVEFGGMVVGGIRISHMSHIDGAATLVLTASKTQRKPFVVKVLEAPKPAEPPAPKVDAAMDWARALVAKIAAVHDAAALEEITADPDVVEKRAKLAADRPKLAERIDGAVRDALAMFSDTQAGA